MGNNVVFSALFPYEGQMYGLLKIGMLVILLIYVFFALIVVRQIGVMNHVLQTKITSLLTFLGFLHLMAVLLIFILAFTL